MEREKGLQRRFILTALERERWRWGTRRLISLAPLRLSLPIRRRRA
jgi:hypothetical protein